MSIYGNRGYFADDTEYAVIFSKGRYDVIRFYVRDDYYEEEYLCQGVIYDEVEDVIRNKDFSIRENMLF